MKYARHSKILEIIRSEEIYTQDELSAKLKEAGYKATQATVSRDIKELNLIKVPGVTGKSRYVDTPRISDQTIDKFSKILRETILTVNSSDNIVVIKTLNGCANAAAEIIDRVPYEEVLGSIAGDNTIFLVIDKKEHVNHVVKMINETLA